LTPTPWRAVATGAMISTSTWSTAVRHCAAAMRLAISSRLHCENCELAVDSVGAIRKAFGLVAAQALPASPSCGAPKLWPISCAATSEMSAALSLPERASVRLADCSPQTASR